MNFIRLLTVGKSLKQTRSESSPYKLCPDYYLPKFGPRTPGVEARPSPSSSPTPSAADVRYADSLFSCSPAMTAASANAFHPSLKELANPAESFSGAVQSVPEKISKSETDAPTNMPLIAAMAKELTAALVSEPAAAPAGSQRASSGRWALKRNPFFGSKSAPVSPPVVQPELSLDAVKVVRNDLAGDDLELVSTSIRRVPARDHGSKEQSAFTAWTRAAARVMQKEKAVSTI